MVSKCLTRCSSDFQSQFSFKKGNMWDRKWGAVRRQIRQYLPPCVNFDVFVFPPLWSFVLIVLRDVIAEPLLVAFVHYRRSSTFIIPFSRCPKTISLDDSNDSTLYCRFHANVLRSFFVDRLVRPIDHATGIPWIDRFFPYSECSDSLGSPERTSVILFSLLL